MAHDGREILRRLELARSVSYYKAGCHPGYLLYLAIHECDPWKLRDIAAHKKITREAALILLTEDVNARFPYPDHEKWERAEALSQMESNLICKFHNDPEIMMIFWEKKMVAAAIALIYHLGTEHDLVLEIYENFPDSNGSVHQAFLAMQYQEAYWEYKDSLAEVDE